MPSYKIAIQPDNTLLGSNKRQSFSKGWSERLRQQGHVAHMVSVHSPDFFNQLDGCHGFMWWFPQMPGRSTWAKRLMLALDHALDIPLFPNQQTIWHFEDKIAQSYLLQAAGVPIPQTWVLWRYKDAISFCRTAQYPLVIKLATGIMSRNVKLLHNVSEAEYWINRLFGTGLFALEYRLRAVAKRLRKDLRHMVKRVQRNPGRHADLQTNYLLVQEFLSGNDFDTRITVIGNRVFGFRRWNRPGDFRASGSGRIDYHHESIEIDAVMLAFDVAGRLGTQSLAVDVLRRDGKPVINEISYYYEGWAVAACPGHWELRGSDKLEWVEGQIAPEDAILQDFLASVERRFKGAVHAKA